MLRKGIFWIIAVIVVGIIALIFLNNVKDKQTADSIDYTGQPYLGKADARVSIIEFGDYKCPACKSFHQLIVPLIVEEFVDTGKAKFYFINNSFINVDSHRAAQFAETVLLELGNETFWAFHDLLLSKQPDDMSLERTDVLTDEYLEATLAEMVSAEQTAQVMQAFAAEKGKAAWEKDNALARTLGVVSTPTMFVNGVEFTGNSLEEFREMIIKATK